MAKRELNSDVLAHLILLRILCESDMGVGIDAVRRDLKPFVEHRLSASEWQALCDRLVEALGAAGLIEIGLRKILVPQPKAKEVGENFLGHPMKSSPIWVALINYDLIALILGLGGAAQSHIKKLGQVGELRHAILQSCYGLPVKAGQSASAVRNLLACVALEKGFGVNFKKMAKGKVSMPGRTGRMIAGQLLAQPKYLPDDGKLIAKLAAEKIGAGRMSLPALRSALWRQMVEGKGEAQSDLSADLKMFSDLVHIKAKERAKGWPGNRKAYISHVWNSIRSDCPELRLDEMHFKAKLAEAHRAGHVNLINADLKSSKNMVDIKASAVSYKNTEWHFIRVDE